MMALLGGHGHEKGRAMKHRNSVLHGMLSYLPWKVFDELVAAQLANAKSAGDLQALFGSGDTWSIDG